MNSQIAATKRILLVEDDSNDLELMLAAIEKDGLRDAIDVARDGREAFDYLLRRGAYAQREATLPVAVILDMNMPVMGGIELLETIQNYDELREIPVIVLTSSVNKREELKRKNIPVLMCAMKPIPPAKYNELMRQLDTLIRKLLAATG